jgi:prepilin-type N-terminal cleavage/methylation domain-containing protein
MGRVPMRSSDGFTLIEVLAAVLIVSLVFGLLLESVTRNLADLGRVRAEARAAQLAEDRLRDMRIEIEAGTRIEDGVTQGTFDDPDQDMHWQIAVTPQTLALPAGYRGEMPPSPLFYAQNGPPRVPAPAPLPGPAASHEPGDTGPAEPLRLVEIRVFPQGTDPQAVEPFVFLITGPPDTTQLPQPGTPGAPGQQTDPNGLGAAHPATTSATPGMGSSSP